MSDLSFRPPAASDVETIARFQEAMAAETEGITLDGATVRRGVAAVLEDPALGRYWLAVSDGRVIGSLLLTYEWSDWRNARIWWIQSVWVEPEWRGKGVYKKLYAHVQDLARDDPAVAGIRLYVDQRNARAQGVYRALGMNGDHYTTFEWMK